MAFTIEQLQPFKAKVDFSYNSSTFQNNLALVIAYLTGDANALAGVATCYDNGHFRNLSMLVKQPGQWDHNDQLVLDVVAHSLLGPGVLNGFAEMIAQKVDASGTEQDWNSLIGFWEKHLPLIGIFQSLLHANGGIYDQEKRTVKNTLTVKWLKAFFITADKTAVTTLFKQYSRAQFSRDLLGLLIECHPSLVDLYLQQNLEDGQFLNITVVYWALKYDSGKYLAYVIEKIRSHYSHLKNRESVENRFNTLWLLQSENPEPVKELLAQAANDYLALYVSIDDKGWEHRIRVQGDSSEFSVVATTVLLEADPAAVKDKLWDIIQQTKYLPFALLAILADNFKAEAFPFVSKALQADVSIGGVRYHKKLLELLEHSYKDKYNDALWELVQHKSKQIRQLAIQALGADDSGVEKCAALLNHKSADARQAAAQILGMIGTPEAKTVLQKAIAGEKNDDARDIMLQVVAEGIYDEAGDEMIAQLIEDARNRGKLAKPLEEWLTEAELPTLYYANGTQLSKDEIRFLLYRMNRVKTMRSDLEARLIIDRLDKEKAAEFALHLIKLFIDKNTKPEHKYLLALSALLGNEAVAEKIRITIDKWIDDSRFKMAEYGVGALALQGSNKALRWVELYSRKYKTKKANVGAAALAALEAAAEELNITVYELGDRIVPDFGFEGLFREFDVDGENYRAFIDSNFKIAFFNDDNKKLKAIPASADSELKEAFKAIAKEVRDVVKSQSSRLEHYLVVQRRWNKAQWEQFFLTNPVMFIYATKLVWGIYDKNVLKQCFYCQEDTTLVDVEDNEILIEEAAQIGIVHPLQLPESELKQWQRKFFDLSVEPVFSQLDRKIYPMTPEDKQVTIIQTFNGIKTESGSIKTTLERYGWRKGPTGDGGTIDTFFKDDHAGNLMAVLEVEGVSVSGFDSDYDPKLGMLYFRNRPKERKAWVTHPKDDKDPVLIPLGNLPEVFYSEVMTGVKAIKVHTVKDEVAQ
ncbi:DUF4132 domain-containing protein [Niastella populi]|uniref:DUF4132 domain-containing protein n=1 Tax=Niastella populi TaxID=550983 RepID=A0A1V9FJD8_9BACT|nr:DUF4132 domain-containing protein [Niastella populi]OQP58407.1 hypothetical protein A4R26_02820 [Niastella populi]